MTALAPAAAPFGELIREWRAIRRYSQLQLSLEAEVSARHVSFLESGRAAPSRAMVMKLAEALQMPKEATNQALTAAGYAQAFERRPPDAEALAPVRAAVAHMLKSHEPFPAVAVDAHWDLVGANDPAIALFGATGVAGAANMIDALVAVAESDVIENWEEIALLTLVRLREEITAAGGDRTLERYASQVAAQKRLADADISRIDFSQAVIPTVFRIGGARLSLFSTIAQFSAVHDVSASELRIEMFFPADDATREWFEARA